MTHSKSITGKIQSRRNKGETGKGAATGSISAEAGRIAEGGGEVSMTCHTVHLPSHMAAESKGGPNDSQEY